MDEGDLISDDEELYRSIRGQLDKGEYQYDESGQLIITRYGFQDRHKEPSVDRAKLRNFDPSLSKQNPTDGIVSLISRDVRAIGDVETKGDEIKRDEINVKHAVNVIYKPIRNLPVNLAHSEITVNPKFLGSKNKQKNAFKLLRIALARLATKTGWTSKP